MKLDLVIENNKRSIFFKNHAENKAGRCNCMYIASAYLPSCDVINFEINLIFAIKQFFYMAKKSRQKFKYLEKQRF